MTSTDWVVVGWLGIPAERSDRGGRAARGDDVRVPSRACCAAAGTVATAAVTTAVAVGAAGISRASGGCSRSVPRGNPVQREQRPVRSDPLPGHLRQQRAL